jgi:aspartyl-tRNA(Asn)/glutamyl-tRNA(Gln) amidotransferase subunit C
MTITADQVRHVANLARLSIDPAVVDPMARQLGAILAYMEKLNAVDTREVPVTAHAIALTNAFREDTVAEHLAREQALANAPAQAAGGFVVPKVI